MSWIQTCVCDSFSEGSSELRTAFFSNCIHYTHHTLNCAYLKCSSTCMSWATTLGDHTLPQWWGQALWQPIEWKNLAKPWGATGTNLPTSSSGQWAFSHTHASATAEKQCRLWPLQYSIHIPCGGDDLQKLALVSFQVCRATTTRPRGMDLCWLWIIRELTEDLTIYCTENYPLYLFIILHWL